MDALKMVEGEPIRSCKLRNRTGPICGIIFSAISASLSSISSLGILEIFGLDKAIGLEVTALKKSVIDESKLQMRGAKMSKKSKAEKHREETPLEFFRRFRGLRLGSRRKDLPRPAPKFD